MIYKDARYENIFLRVGILPGNTICLTAKESYKNCKSEIVQIELKPVDAIKLASQLLNLAKGNL